MFFYLKRQLKIIHEFNNRKATKLRSLKVKLRKITVALLTYAVSVQLQQQQTFSRQFTIYRLCQQFETNVSVLEKKRPRLASVRTPTNIKAIRVVSFVRGCEAKRWSH
jgi:hypothetical protein